MKSAATPTPTPPPPLAQSRPLRIARAIWNECQFVFVPQGGWTTKRAVGRLVLGLIAVSGAAGLGLVGGLVLLKERKHIASGIRRGVEVLRQHLASRHPAPRPTPPRAPSPPRRSRPAPTAPAPTAPTPTAPTAPTPTAPTPTGRRRPKQKVLS